MALRYVLIRDDADVATIDEALTSLRSKRLATVLPMIRAWITEDIDALLTMRTAATPRHDLTCGVCGAPAGKDLRRCRTCETRALG